MCLLHLVEEVYNELGYKQKIKVVFRDEELIPDEVINFVQSYYHTGKYDFRYLCLQLKSEKYIMGKKEEYVQWDKNRKHIRPIPEFGITDNENVYDQYTCDEFVVKGLKGKSIILTGVRAEESLVRLQSILTKKNDSYISATSSRVFVGKPLYDWLELDVFKYFYDNKIPYCKIYDMQLFNGENLRVSTPLHAESSKKIYKIKTRSPIFWEQLVALFPEIEIQARYYDQLSKSNVFGKYAMGPEGIYQYIEETFEGAIKELAITRTKAALLNRSGKKGTDNYGGYPYLHIFRQIVNGNFKRQIFPKIKPTKEEIEYEQKYDRMQKGKL